MTVRHLRIETPVLGFGWHEVVDLDDASPIVAALIANGRVSVASGVPGPAQSWRPTNTIWAGTTPDTTGLADGTLWVSPSTLAVLTGGSWTPLGGGGGVGGTAAVDNGNGTVSL